MFKKKDDEINIKDVNVSSEVPIVYLPTIWVRFPVLTIPDKVPTEVSLSNNNW